MKLSDFEHATEDERDLMAIRASTVIRTDDHAFAAMVARICGTAGPKAVDAAERGENGSSLHGSDEGSH